jgi:chemotaxis-related protein WspD
MNNDSELSVPFVTPVGPSPTQSLRPDDAPEDCWNRIGVYGNKSCADLQTLVHCRNCPVYTMAGRHLLERDIPENYRREWTDLIALKRKSTAPEDRSAVFFRVNSEWLALPTQVLQEVAERKTIHSLPHRKAGILLGLANVRGELVICVSLSHMLGIEPMRSQAAVRTQYRRLLVAIGSGSRVSFPVDEVSGSERFRTELLRPPLPGFAGFKPGFILNALNWRGRTAGLLDADRIFTAIDSNLT